MTALRILIGADTFPPDVNGAARFADRLARGLARRGHEVHVAAPSPDGPARTEHRDGVVIHRLRSYRAPGQPTFRICLPWQAGPATDRLIHQLKPDVVHVQAHFVVGRGLAVAAEQTRCPLVATNHFMPENLFAHARIPAALQAVAARWAWRDLARVYRRADVVTAPTPRAVELLASAAGVMGALPVSCGIDATRFTPGQRVESDEPVVLFVGRLDPEKRVDELLRAFAILPPGTPGRMEIVGDGSRRVVWQELAEQLGIAHRVTFRGVISDDELVAAYARADVFCMPGIAELQSLATLEAMAAATPVVAANAMALPHLVQPGRNGWLYHPGKISELAAALGTLLSDPALRRRMGAAGRDIALQHDLDATLERFEQIYTGVVEHVPARPYAA